MGGAQACSRYTGQGHNTTCCTGRYLGAASEGSWVPVLAAGPKALAWAGVTFTGMRALGAEAGLEGGGGEGGGGGGPGGPGWAGGLGDGAPPTLRLRVVR